MSPASLPTPAPSTEIPPGKRASFSTIDNAFSLPPAAIANPASKQNSSASSTSSVASAASDSSYRPISPLPATNAAQSAQRTDKTPRRRSSTVNNQTSNTARLSGGYTLPPPPTRSRKIIQMKPRTQNDAQPSSAATSPVFTGKTQPSPSLTGQTTPKASASSTPTASQSGTATAGTKRKQPNGPTTAAGRKIARKTAHSLIERRRRSKMNEEFGVLKDMIPACAGQDMHKLQVLSASIEYMRYLEKCLAELKAVHALCPAPHTQQQQQQQQQQQPPSVSPFRHTSSALGSSAASAVIDDDDESGSDDEEMADAPPPAPSHAHQHHYMQQQQQQQQQQHAAAPHTQPYHHATHSTHSARSHHTSSLSPAIQPASQTATPFAPTPLDAVESPIAISSSQIRAAFAAFTPSFPGSGLPSPVFGGAAAAPAAAPPLQAYGGSHTSASAAAVAAVGSFRLTSPALGPQRSVAAASASAAGVEERGAGAGAGGVVAEREDQEATAALLMLNTDRRSWSGQSGGPAAGAQQGRAASTSSAKGEGGRGMSVRDLLSG